MLGWLVLAAAAAAARPKPNAKPDTLFKGPGVTILDRQGVQAIRSDKRVQPDGSSRFMLRGRPLPPLRARVQKFGAALQSYPNIKAGAVSCTAERKACDRIRSKAIQQ